MNKRDVRKSFTERRLLLTAAETGELSGKIIDLFSSLSLQGILHLLSYYPIPERREFDPAPCEQLLQLENQELKIYWPKLYDDEGSMEAHPKDENTRLVLNRFGIPEPETSFFVEPQLIDAVFVPLLAFDLKGFRVGYGKGFYDRYLSRCAQDVVKIGFSFFGPLDRISDVNEYDIPLSFCITPERIYEF